MPTEQGSVCVLGLLSKSLEKGDLHCRISEAGSEVKTHLSAWVKAMAAMKLIEPDSPNVRVPAMKINHHLYEALDFS